MQKTRLSEDSFKSFDQTIDIKWTNLSVFVESGQPSPSKVKVEEMPLLQKQKQILFDVTGYAKNGETLAIMGPSGAGKTTLLSILTQKMSLGNGTKLTGECLANGRAYNSSQFTAFGVFVMQNDLLFPCLTVKETLMFSARMKLDCSEQEKEKKVKKLIEDLQLTQCQDTYIGSTLVKGISGGERKRACIGVELVSNPTVIILDEPTSGLDSFTAYTTMNILKDLAKSSNKCIILSIHSPSYDIFQLIDRLLLMSNGYAGSTSQIIPYIQSLGQQVPEYQNICDFFMYEIKKKPDSTVLNPVNYENKLRKQIDAYINDEHINSTNGYSEGKVTHTFLYQIKYLIVRSYLNYIRNPQLLTSRLYSTTWVTIYFTILYFGICKTDLKSTVSEDDKNELIKYIDNCKGLLYRFCLIFFFQAIGPVASMFPRERAIFLKEQGSKSYDTVPYFLSKILVELQFILLQPLFMGTVVYLAMQFQYDWIEYLKFTTTCIVLAFCGNGIGILTGTFFSDAQKAAELSPLFFISLQLFGGQYANLATVKWYFSWVQYVSPYRYGFEALLRTFFETRIYEVGDSEENVIKKLDLNLSYSIALSILFSIGLFYHILALVFLKLSVKKISV